MLGHQKHKRDFSASQSSETKDDPSRKQPNLFSVHDERHDKIYILSQG